MSGEPNKLDKGVKKVSLFVGYFFLIATVLTVVSTIALEQWRKYDAQADLMPEQRK